MKSKSKAFSAQGWTELLVKAISDFP